jgi:FMN hydrolase / 5-amino-6-(5-phospho-D-ribitylamino)uracil phosphatase
VIRGVIFDLGGTLAAPLNPEELDRRNTLALLAWLRQRSGPLDNAFVDVLVEARQAAFAHREGAREVTAAEVLGPVLQRYGLPYDPSFTQAAEEAFFEPELASMRALPGANTLLAWVHDRGLRAGLASNASSQYFVVECCRRLEFARWLDPILTSAGVGWTKPSPPIFEAILARWSLAPGEVVMVGDTPSADIGGAVRIGMRSILLAPDRGPHRIDETDARPEDVARDLAGVRTILAQWINGQP